MSAKWVQYLFTDKHLVNVGSIDQTVPGSAEVDVGSCHADRECHRAPPGFSCGPSHQVVNVGGW
jgi:hypothetical protein